MTDRPICLYEGCGRVVTRRNLCHRHYNEERGVVYTRINKSGCICGGLHYAKGMCKNCYMSWFRAGRKSLPEPLPNEKYFNDFWVWTAQHLGVSGAADRRVKF